MLIIIIIVAVLSFPTTIYNKAIVIITVKDGIDCIVVMLYLFIFILYPVYNIYTLGSIYIGRLYSIYILIYPIQGRSPTIYIFIIQNVYSILLLCQNSHLQNSHSRFDDSTSSNSRNPRISMSITIRFYYPLQRVY